MTSPTRTITCLSAEADAIEARFGLRIAARLSEQAAQTSPQVGERLRFARERALAQAAAARSVAQAATSASASGGAASMRLGRGGDEDSSWWLKIASLLPLVALIAGLVMIQKANTRAQIHAAAEIDAALLADDLPPTAYSDPGFVAFLQSPRD